MPVSDPLQHVRLKRDGWVLQQDCGAACVSDLDQKRSQRGSSDARGDDWQDARIEPRHEIGQIVLGHDRRAREHQSGDVGPVRRKLRDHLHGRVRQGTDRLGQGQPHAWRRISGGQRHGGLEPASVRDIPSVRCESPRDRERGADARLQRCLARPCDLNGHAAPRDSIRHRIVRRHGELRVKSPYPRSRRSRCYLGRRIAKVSDTLA